MTVCPEWMGPTTFLRAEETQRRCREEVLTVKGPERLLCTVHEAVFVSGIRIPSPKDLPQNAEPWIREIPIVRSKRGGLLTYHGPGQLMVYCIIDVRRRKITIPDLVCRLEAGVMSFLSDLGLEAERKTGAPGVWVRDQKICAVGLHFRRWVSMYGIALNLNPDLRPFLSIRPCGFSGANVTSVAALGGGVMNPEDVWRQVVDAIMLAIDAKAVDSFCGNGYPVRYLGT